ncbi:DEAD-domain-containing protein [Wallemia mellicola]|nr:DEAD-domain-containing protein [Wallemia mellicola]
MLLVRQLRTAGRVALVNSRLRYTSTLQSQKEFPQLSPSTVQTGSFHPIAPEDSHLRREDVDAFTTVSDKLSRHTIQAITVSPHKHTKMSPVQSAIFNLLPSLVDNHSKDRKDLFVKSKTGTGKTMAFLVPAIEARVKAIKEAGDAAGDNEKAKLKASKVFANSSVGAVIVSPTRELATQIANEAIKLCTHHKGFQVRLFVGGANKGRQLSEFKNGRADIVVTTPGRMNDVLQTSPMVREALSTSPMLILDEADTLLEMGFKDELNAIIDHLPSHPTRQSILLSATLSPAIRTVAKSILKSDHLYIDTVPEGESNSHAKIPQYYSALPNPSHQLPHLLRLIAHDQLTNPKSKIMIFCPTTKMTMLYSTIFRALSKELPTKANVFEIHSKRTMEQRSRASELFRKDKTDSSLLVTSDVSARGVDYPNVTRVIQIGIPPSADQYVHRIGRTGRGDNNAGRADFIMDSYELPFLTWQLNQHNIIDNPAKEFVKEVTQLAESSGKQGALDKVNNIENAVSDLISQVDELAVRETFASLLGYYMPKAGVLRTTKGVVIEGLKSWTTDAMGLEKPPYISDLFLQKLGLTDNRTKKFGNRDRYTGSESKEYYSVAQRNGGKDRGLRYNIDGKQKFRGPDKGTLKSEWDKRGLYSNRGQGRPPPSERNKPELNANEFRGAPSFSTRNIGSRSNFDRPNRSFDKPRGRRQYMTSAHPTRAIYKPNEREDSQKPKVRNTIPRARVESHYRLVEKAH